MRPAGALASYDQRPREVQRNERHGVHSSFRETGDSQPERAEILPTEEHTKLRSPLSQADIGRAKIRHIPRMFVEAVRLIAFDDAREQCPQALIVGAENGQAIERHFIHELEKTVIDPFHGSVMVKMLAVEIRYGRNRRRKAEKRSVTFIGFRYQEVPASQPSMAPQGIDLAAYYHRGV